MAELRIGQSASEGGHVLARQPCDAGQVGPLVVERFQCGGVEEQRCAVLAAFAVERCGDEVAHAAARVDVLGGKQPVITAEVHTAAELKSLAGQTGRNTARCCRRRDLRKEDPHRWSRPDCDTSNAAGTLWARAA